MELSKQVQTVAEKELREDQSARDQCLQQMRDWLSKNEDVEDVRIDDVFLLRFLRTKKFSVPMAQQLLLKYLNLKKILPRMVTELDFLSSPLKEVFEIDYLFVSPVKDQHGRSVIISRAAFHIINVQSTVKWALDVGRRLVSRKINDRINLYSSWSEFNEKFDPSCLPKELGGTIPMAETIQWWMQQIAAKRDIVVQLDKMKLLSDRGITKKNVENLSLLHAEIRGHMDKVAGSFRKLEVD
ncbi:hypothetical protein HA402_005551 [Bradysia odoriphaga]|nr:hypothetical protein HA402_005551 [Bradysia odoriphaga]